MVTKYIILIFAVLAVLAVAIYFFHPTPTATTMEAVEMAKSSVSFLEDKKRSDGLYTYSEKCNDKGCENDPLVYVQTNAWPILAYVGLYESTGSAAYLEKAKDEMVALKKSCEKNREECLWVLVQMHRLYLTTKDQSITDYIKILGERLYSRQPDNSSVMISGIEAREMAMMYGLTNDQKYVTAAVDRLELSRSLKTPISVKMVKDSPVNVSNIAYSIGDFDFHTFSCWPELANIELYKVTGEEQYLIDARSFFDKSEVGNHGRDIEQMTGIEPCIDALLQLSIITKSDKYKQQAINLMQYVVTYRWDSSIATAKKYNGNNGILFHRYSDYENFKSVTDTSYIIFLLSQLKDYEFKILRWR